MISCDCSPAFSPRDCRASAHAWSFVHYLFARNDGLIDLLLRGSEPPNVEELEKGWRKHLTELK